jgi:asparagine synthase (glutamine-hydrolysing)
MCGIYGIARLVPRGPEEAFSDLVGKWFQSCDRLLFQRGPDSGGSLVESGVGLGARRLRVHDLSTRADQPFETDDEQIAVVWNGAIFNYRALRDELRAAGYRFNTTGDTEVVALGYNAWGEGLFARLSGMFAIAILDRAKNRVVIGRDKLGIKPLYIHRAADFVAFSSEIKPLLAHPDIPKAVDKNAVAEQLAYQFLMPPRTLFKGIEVFLPGHVATIDLDKGSEDIRAYWQLDSAVIDAPNAKNHLEALVSSLQQCWDADRTAGVQLSGGVDSSLVCLLSQERLGIDDYSTFSVLFDDSTAKYYLPRSEEAYINRIADQCGLDNHAWTFTADQVRPALAEAIWYYEQPLYGASTALYMLLAREIKEYVTVLITGEGADDIFLGYFQDWDFTLSPEGLFKMFIARPTLEKMVGKDGVDGAMAGRWDLVNSPRLKDMSLPQKASAATIETVLHGLLARHDRMFMSNSIEGRPPFCTDDMILARYAMADDSVHNGKTGKIAYKELLASYTDKNFAFRKKIGFSAPFGDWCSDPGWWNGYVDGIDYDIMSEFLNVDVLRDHTALPEGAEKWSGQNLNMIFSVAQLQLWHRIFFESGDFSSPDAWRDCVPA